MRSSDDLSSGAAQSYLQNHLLTNGDGVVAAGQAGENNGHLVMDVDQNKKVKLEGGGVARGGSGAAGSSPGGGSGIGHQHQAEPSKVVHLRNIPPDASEAEVIQIGLPFGKVTNILMLKGKNQQSAIKQAFLELGDVQCAVSMVQFYQNSLPSIRGRQVYVQYSNHKELKTENMPAAANMAAQAALQAASMGATIPTSMGGAVVGLAQGMQGMQGLQGLQGMQGLQGLQSATGGSQGLHSLQAVQAAAAAALPAPEAQTQGGVNCVLRVIVDRMAYPVNVDILYQIFSRFGRVLRIITFTKDNFPDQFQALIQMANAQEAAQAKLLDGQNIYNGCCTLRIEFSKLTNLNVKYNNEKSRDFTNPHLATGDPNHMQVAALNHPIAAAAAAAAAAGMDHNSAAAALGVNNPLQHIRYGIMGMPGVPGMAAGSPVVLVSNLNEDVTTPEHLFILFGVYGDVHRVKILFNKKDNALIQFADPTQAQLALQHLNNVRLFGKTLRVAASKHSLVQMPKEGQPDAGLTKDYTNSTLHRFKKPGSKNYQNIFAPSAVLHLSNIPAVVTEKDIQDLFADWGRVEAFRFFPKDRKMALIQMSSVEEAVTALVKLHNHRLSDNQNLRVSFSKTSMD